MLVYLSKNNIRFINKESKRLKKVHSFGAKSATYFLHKTSSLLKRKKQRKQLLMVIAALVIIYFLPVLTQLWHQYFG